jgi:hypothetical protein
VIDRKPPRLAGDERATVLALLQYQRESLVRKVADLDEADADRALVGSGTTLRWLVRHLAHAERLWVLHRFAGGPQPPMGERGTMADAVADYERAWSEVDAAIGGASFDDECRDFAEDANVDLRWVLLHLLEETARHAGHADILRELIDGRTGR